MDHLRACSLVVAVAERKVYIKNGGGAGRINKIYIDIDAYDLLKKGVSSAFS